jgi:two-component SAPR family response regulator
MKGNLHEGLDLLNQAEAIFRENDDPAGLTMTLVRRATAHRFLGDYQAALQDSDEVIKLTEYEDDLQLTFADALRQKGLSLYRQGDTRRSVKVLEHALEIYTRMDDTSHIPVLKMETGMAYAALGRADDTIRLNDEALKIWKQEGNLTWQANVLNNMGVLHHLQGDYDKAVLTLEEGLLCATRGGYFVRMEAVLLISLGDVYADVEDFSLADQYYQQGQEIAEEIEDRLLLNYLMLARAKLYIQQRKLDQANHLLDKARKSISPQDSQYEDGLYHLLRGQLLLHEANVEQAVEALDIAEVRFESDGHNMELIKSQLLLAGAYCQEQNIADAQYKLKEVLHSKGQTEYSILVFLRQEQTWLDGLQNDSEVGSALRALLYKVDQINEEMPEIRRRIRRLARTMEMPDAKLTIQGIGRPQVKVGEKLLNMSDWQTQSVRDLFFYFLAMEEPMTKEQIGTALWPDLEEPSKLKIRFKNDIYRLRRAVGSDTILFENDLYGFNRSMDYEYDVEAFEGFLYQAKLAKDSEMQIKLYQKAVNLVGGNFLEGVDAEWVLIERERINQEFLPTLLVLADLLKNNNKVHEALATYQQAIEHDPTFEAAYLAAMRIYLQLDDRVSGHKLYESYTEMMLNELDLPPSLEMEAYQKRLMH